MAWKKSEKDPKIELTGDAHRDAELRRRARKPGPDVVPPRVPLRHG